MRKPPDIVICECWPEEPDDEAILQEVNQMIEELKALCLEAEALIASSHGEFERTSYRRDLSWICPFYVDRN